MSEKSQPVKPSVIIDLPPILEAFLRFATETPKDQDEIIVKRRDDFGKCINGFLSKGNTPPENNCHENPVRILVPRTKNNWYSIETNYVYISKEDQETITDRIAVLYNQWIDIFFEDGYKLNLSQLEIIKSILDILNLRVSATNFELIKKRDYRKGRSTVRFRSQLILKQRKSSIYKSEKYFSDFE